jgi:hypothetical protein
MVTAQWTGHEDAPRPLRAGEVGCWRRGCDHVGTLAGYCPCHSTAYSGFGHPPCQPYLRTPLPEPPPPPRVSSTHRQRGRGADIAQAVADHVIAIQRTTGVPPTVREVGRAFGWASSSTAMNHLMHCAALGLLTHLEGAISRPFRAPILDGHCGACGHALAEP